MIGALMLIAGMVLLNTDWCSFVRYGASILALIVAVLAVQHRRWRGASE